MTNTHQSKNVKCIDCIRKGLSWNHMQHYTRCPIQTSGESSLTFRSSRFWDKGVEGGAVTKKTFSTVQASVWSNNKGGGPPGPSLDLPLQAEAFCGFQEYHLLAWYLFVNLLPTLNDFLVRFFARFLVWYFIRFNRTWNRANKIGQETRAGTSFLI